MSSLLRWLKNGVSPLVLGFILYYVVNFSTTLIEVPLIRLYEKSICNRYYRSKPRSSFGLAEDIDESFCKLPAIQSTLGAVTGWKISFNAAPGLLTTVFYGLVAEHYGRRLVRLLSIVGLLLEMISNMVICSFDTVFPTQLVWASSVFYFIGGGQSVFKAMTFTLISDILPDSHRTKFLYVLSSGPHINRFISPRIAAALMRRSILSPFYLSISLLSTAILVAAVSTVKDPIPQNEEGVATPLLSTPVDEYSTLPEVQGPPQLHDCNDTEQRPEVAAQPRFLRRIATSLTILYPNAASRFCLAAYFVKHVAFTSEMFMFQYASEKFDWPLRETTWLRVAVASGAITTTLVVCPTLSHILVKHRPDSHTLDHNIIRVSLFILTFSFFMAWRAITREEFISAMVGCGLGEGLEPALQGSLTFLTKSSHNSRVFSMAGWLDTIAELTSGPLTAQLLTIGRRPGHTSDGYSFLSSSIMFGGLAIASLCVSTRS